MVSEKPRLEKKKKKKNNEKKSKYIKNPNLIPLGNNRVIATINREKENAKTKEGRGSEKDSEASPIQQLYLSNASSSLQLSFFLDRFQSCNGIHLSSLELEEFKESCMVELSEGLSQDASNLGKHLKAIFGVSWKEELSDGQLIQGKISVGSPAVLIISTSALRSLELLRGVRSLTKECRPAKLFAKHIKVENQVSLLKNRVNITCGTPSRVKKLIDMDALGLSRLALVMLDMQTDAKGYSLFTLPQVSDEFWDLYRSQFHQLLLQGNLRLCFYGPTRGVDLKKFLAP